MFPPSGDGSPKISRVLFLGVAVEGEVAGVGQQLLALHQPVDLVLGGLVFFLATGLSQVPWIRMPKPVRPGSNGPRR